ncbi:unnamed protein product [Ilex paraguariensis]|uniref:Uncharacterized protein n=1 Tax=Ilex paraguariensis TaxID=185542 RepID=A0ABC8QNR6_9AQUA
MWAWERLSHIRPQRLLSRGPLHDVHPDAGLADAVPPAPVLAQGLAPDVPVYDDLPVRPRGCR